MLRTHGRVASCQPAAALSVSCLVAVCLSFTHSTHSFARLPPRLSLSLSLSHTLSPDFFGSSDLCFFSRLPLKLRWPRYSAHLPAKIFFRRRWPPRRSPEFVPDVVVAAGPPSGLTSSFFVQGDARGRDGREGRMQISRGKEEGSSRRYDVSAQGGSRVSRVTRDGFINMAAA